METKEYKEYHENGQLSYKEKRVYLHKDTEFLYDNRIQGDNGSCFIRTGVQAKYHDNGVLAWKLTRDNLGNVVAVDKGNRKDGTEKVY